MRCSVEWMLFGLPQEFEGLLRRKLGSAWLDWTLDTTSIPEYMDFMSKGWGRMKIGYDTYAAEVKEEFLTLLKLPDTLARLLKESTKKWVWEMHQNISDAEIKCVMAECLVFRIFGKACWTQNLHSWWKGVGCAITMQPWEIGIVECQQASLSQLILKSAFCTTVQITSVSVKEVSIFGCGYA